MGMKWDGLRNSAAVITLRYCVAQQLSSHVAFSFIFCWIEFKIFVLESKVDRYRSTRVQWYGSTGYQEKRRPGVQEYRSTEVQGPSPHRLTHQLSTALTGGQLDYHKAFLHQHVHRRAGEESQGFGLIWSNWSRSDRETFVLDSPLGQSGKISTMRDAVTFWIYFFKYYIILIFWYISQTIF